MSQRKLGITLNYINEIIKILTVLLYTPVMLRLLGQAEYGLYQLAVSLASNLGLLSLGFGGAYVRFFARCRDAEELSRLNGMFLLIFSLLGTVCLLCGGWMVWKAPMVFGSTLSRLELERARWLLGFQVGSMTMTFWNSVFDCHIAARERFGVQNGLRILQSLLSPFLTLPLLVLGYGSVAVTAVSALLTLLIFLFNVGYCRKRLTMGFLFRGLPFGMLRELGAFAFFLFLNQLMDQLNWSVDRILLGRMCGTAFVAVYGIGAQINTLYIQLSTAISSVFAPRVHRMAAQGADPETLTRLMIQVGSLQLKMLLLILGGFVLFGRPFLRLWAGEGYGESYSVALLLMTPMTVPLVQNLGIEIQRAKNRHRARSVVYACLAAGNVLLSIPLIRRWGPAGAAAGTAITQMLGTVFFMNWYYHRKMGLHMDLFWKEMARTALPLLPAFAAGCLWISVYPIQSWGSLLFSGMLYTGSYILILWEQKKDRPKACP